jgi:hypothetical protein
LFPKFGYGKSNLYSNPHKSISTGTERSKARDKIADKSATKDLPIKGKAC